MKPLLDEEERLKAAVLGWYPDLAADQTTVAEGGLYSLQIGKRENRRTIANPKRAFGLLKKVLGLEALYEAITIPLKLIDRHVSIADQRRIILQERTGPREITAVARAPIEAAAKAV